MDFWTASRASIYSAFDMKPIDSTIFERIDAGIALILEDADEIYEDLPDDWKQRYVEESIGSLEQTIFSRLAESETISNSAEYDVIVAAAQRRFEAFRRESALRSGYSPADTELTEAYCTLKGQVEELQRGIDQDSGELLQPLVESVRAFRQELDRRLPQETSELKDQMVRDRFKLEILEHAITLVSEGGWTEMERGKNILRIRRAVDRGLKGYDLTK